MPTKKEPQKPKPPKAEKPKAKAQPETVSEVRMEAVVGAVGMPPGKPISVRLEIPLSAHITDHMIGTLRRLQGEVVTVRLTAKQLDAFRSNQRRNEKDDKPQVPASAGEPGKATDDGKDATPKPPTQGKGKPGAIPYTSMKDAEEAAKKKRTTPMGFGAGK